MVVVRFPETSVRAEVVAMMQINLNAFQPIKWAVIRKLKEAQGALSVFIDFFFIVLFRKRIWCEFGVYMHAKVYLDPAIM